MGCIAAACTPSGSARARLGDVRIRCPGPRDLHDPPCPDEHAVAALVLLNDPTYVEAARKFAERVMLSSTSPRIAWKPLFRSRFADPG